VAQSYPKSPPSQRLSEVDVIERVVREIRDELAPQQPSSPPSPSPSPPPIISQLGRDNVELIDRLVDEIQSEIQQCVREKKKRKYERTREPREVGGGGEEGGEEEENSYADNILAKLNSPADGHNSPINSANAPSHCYSNAEFEVHQTAQVDAFDYGDEDSDDLKRRAVRVAEQRTQIAEARCTVEVKRLRKRTFDPKASGVHREECTCYRCYNRFRYANLNQPNHSIPYEIWKQMCTSSRR